MSQDSMMEASEKLCTDIVPQRYIQVSDHWFQCPYCGLAWERGGKREGFVKAGAMRHVFGCWTVLLLNAGYTTGKATVGGYRAEPVSESHPKIVQSVKAIAKARQKAGLTPTRQPARA